MDVLGVYMDVQEGFMLFRGVMSDFAKPVVDIATTSRSMTLLVWMAS